MTPPFGTTTCTGAVSAAAARAVMIGAITPSSICWTLQGMDSAEAVTVLVAGQTWVEPRSGVMSDTAKLLHAATHAVRAADQAR